MVALALMLVVTTASAWLRLAQPRAACADWPSCRSPGGRLAAQTQPPALAAPAVLAAVRGSHRAAASAALLTAIALVVLVVPAALRRAGGPRDAAAARDASGLLLLALALSVLGIATPGSRSLAVLLGNLLGGLLMVALAARLCARGAWSQPAAPARVAAGAAPLVQRRRTGARAAAIGLALWLAQASLGAGSGFGAGALAAPLHATLGFIAAAWAFGAAGALGRAGARRLGALLRAVALVQGMLGLTVATLNAPPALVLVHNVVTVLGCALLAAGTTLRAAQAVEARPAR